MKNYLLIGVILTGFFVCCSSKKNKKAQTVIPKTLGRLINDSVAPPVVRMISAANAPKVIKVAPPTIVPLSYPYGVGVPAISYYGIAEGLPENGILASAIDKQGNIWFATATGISKYDGSSFTNYNSGNGINSEIINKLFIDSKNNIWIATADGLNIFDGKYFSSISADKDKPEQIIANKIIEDNKGAIWFGTQSGLYKYSHKAFTKFTTADGLADTRIMSVIQDKNDAILISTPKGITSYDGKSFTPYTDLSADKDGGFPNLLYCDSKGIIWFNINFSELGRYDGKQIKIYSKKDRVGIANVFGFTPGVFLEDKKGNYWFGGFGELTKFDGNKFINYLPKDGPASTFHLQSLTEDAQGNIWAGSLNNGIYKISSYLSAMETPVIVARGIAIDKIGAKWSIGPEGLGKYNSDHFVHYGMEQLFFGYGNGELFIDHAGNKWFSATEGRGKPYAITKFDGTDYTIFGKDQGMPITVVRSVLEDDLNNIWFAGKEGVVKFDGSSFTSYGTAQGLPSKNWGPGFQDSKKNYWFGNKEAGVYKYDGHRFTVYTTIDGLPDNAINDIAEDGLGNIWLATDGGAAKFDGKIITSYRVIDGLGSKINDVEYDSINNSIWFSTGIGLASLTMKQVNEEKPIFQYFNSRTGFNFSKPQKLIIDKEGILWGIDNGIFRFDYKTIKDAKPLSLHLKNIKLDNKNISWNTLLNGAYPVVKEDSLKAINEMALKFGKSFSAEDFLMMSKAFGTVSYASVIGSDFIPVNLVLPIKNNNISFEFGSISTSFGKAIQYQYKLEGYDKNWSSLSTKTEASFGNMREGNYTFRVKALSPFGSWSETSYSYKVLPPWYRTWWAYALYIILFALCIYTFIRWRTKALQKEKVILEEKVTTRTNELKESLEHLKSTQSQLIQSEKMASLGELTAGIAHEIQNPLNFVNNFSDLNQELLVEMKDELDKGNLEDVKQIADDVIANEQKINHHGKRAGDIVKGMLQHSRSSSGVKEPTDINALCDEYLRLSYHGLRAKDNSFNATMETDYDQTIGNINIIPQDIGRVILNLINNAFYAAPLPPQGGFSDPDYKHSPTVWVSTKRINTPLGSQAERREGTEFGSVLISIRDNGPGIPNKILDKIFQPFFTTKPTGQGTGLGLSLAYDIVKAHGGELKVETKEGEGSTFIIQMPII